MRIRGIIFDLDGTLFNSIEKAAEIVSEVASEFLKRNVSFSEAVAVLGKSPEEIGEHFGLAGKELLDFGRSLPERFLDKVESFPLFPRTIETLSYLSDEGISIGAVSGAPKKNMQNFLSKARIVNKFSAIISAEDFSGKLSGKPFLEACREMGTVPEETLSIGDAPIDAIGAKISGCIPIGVLSGSGTKKELDDAGCVETIGEISEIPSLLKRRGFI